MNFRPLRGIIFSLAVLAGTAIADPIVDPNSSYSVYLAGYLNNSQVNILNTGPVAFDANAASFSRAGLSLSLTEIQTDLGNGKHSITVTMMANGDLFPTAGEAALIGLGTQGTPLSFLKDVFLDNAHINLLDANGASYFSSTDLADDYRASYFSGSWGGYFNSPNGVFSIGNSGERDTRGFSMTFDVTEIPEPDGAALAALALLALAVASRRRALPPAQ